MIELIIIFLFLFFMLFTVKEYFYHYSTLDYSSTLLAMVQSAALNTNLRSAVEGYREKLIIVYNSGCQTVQSKVTTDFFNTLGNTINNVQISRIDISRNDDPLNFLKGFIHPKYLKKDTIDTNTYPQVDSSYNDHEYNKDSYLSSYFKNYDRQGEDQCDEPNFYTKITSEGTNIESDNENEYEVSPSSTPTVSPSSTPTVSPSDNNDCDYYLVYKTPTILFEIKDHAYLKFPQPFPIHKYPCTPEEQDDYKINIKKYIKQIRYWIYYLKEFSNKLVGLYDLVRLNLSTSCTAESIALITDTVSARDAHYNVIGKYYDILCDAYPITDDEINRLDAYQSNGSHFYREFDKLTTDKDEDLDYLKIDKKKNPNLKNTLSNEPDKLTIRGNKYRLIEYGKRTMIIMFRGYLEETNKKINFIEEYNGNLTPEDLMHSIKNLVEQDGCSNDEVNKQQLIKIFKDNGYPKRYQTWRTYVDPIAGYAKENYGFFLLTFDEKLPNDWEGVCLDSKDQNGENNFPLCFMPYPVDFFDNKAFINDSSDPQVRSFQNIIQPCLLEYGFIKSDRNDKRLFGCKNQDKVDNIDNFDNDNNDNNDDTLDDYLVAVKDCENT